MVSESHHCKPFPVVATLVLLAHQMATRSHTFTDELTCDLSSRKDAMAGILVNREGFEWSKTGPQFYWSAVRLVAWEVHMDHIHGVATQSGRKHFMNDLSHEIGSKGGDGFEFGKPYEHLRRLRIPKTSETRIQPDTKYLEPVAHHLGLTCAKTRPNIGFLTHRATMDAAPFTDS